MNYICYSFSSSTMLCLGIPICRRFGGKGPKLACPKLTPIIILVRNNGTAPPRQGFASPSRFYSSSGCTIPRFNHISCSLPAHSSALPLSTRPDGYRQCEASKTLVKGMTYSELEAWVQSLGYRAGQALMLWRCLYGNDTWAQHVNEMQANRTERKKRIKKTCNKLLGLKLKFVSLNKSYRETLESAGEFCALSLKDVYSAADGTRKILFNVEDGSVIETVVIPCERGRTTVCVSSQVGCAMNCQFCYTGRMGLRKHLTTAEIVEQVVYARRLFTKEIGPLTNVVFMGMGEPLHNIDNVLKAAEIMIDCQGLHFSPRKVTVSTSGLVPGIRRFIRESPCVLAVSLNATTDEVRNWIMPINRKYNLDTLLTTLREEIAGKNKFKVLFEYVMLAGVNDSLEDARRLVNLVEGIPCKINLISFNPHTGSPFIPSTLEQMLAFRNVIADAGCVAFIRHSRGNDQMAACGQLGKPGNGQPPRLRTPEKFQAAIAT